MNAKSKTPRVSVIIPTFDRGWCLREAVDSVLAQEFTDFELIVVDDGSTDGTAELLEVYRPKVRLLRQTNRGVSAARNRGIAAAAGGLIAFLDSDDLWLPQKLATQVDFFRVHPDALIAQTEESWVRNGRRVNPGKRHRKRSGMIFEPSLDLCLVSPSAVMVRRELFDRVGLFDEGLPACEDYDLWLRVSCCIPIHLIDIPLIIKRGGHADQLSRAGGLDQYRIASLLKPRTNGRRPCACCNTSAGSMPAAAASADASRRRSGTRIWPGQVTAQLSEMTFNYEIDLAISCIEGFSIAEFFVISPDSIARLKL
jgi:glycosyltransferase involved in cell wall biosynthesis